MEQNFVELLSGISSLTIDIAQLICDRIFKSLINMSLKNVGDKERFVSSIVSLVSRQFPSVFHVTLSNYSEVSLSLIHEHN
jgi:hypothetical protein